MTTDSYGYDHERDEQRLNEWTDIIRSHWGDATVSLANAQRNAARDLIRRSASEWRVGHRPGSLSFTGMPPLLGNAEPVTRLIDATSSADTIKATLESMGVGERGILVALAAEILAVDAATRYPMRWVADTRPLDEQLDPQGRPVGLDEQLLGHRFDEIPSDEPIPFVPAPVAEAPSMHIGRSWTDHELEDECPCPQASCGLVIADRVTDCDQHSWRAAKTIRQSHAATDCPARAARR